MSPSKGNESFSHGEAAVPVVPLQGLSPHSRPPSGPRNDRALLNSVIANAPIVLWSINRDGVFTVSEGRSLEALGLKPGQVVGQSVYEMYSDYPEVLRDIRHAMSGEEVHSNAEVNGVAFESWYAPLRNAAGQVDGVIGVATNITDRVKAVRARREVEARFEAAFHSSPAAMLITRLDNSRFVDVNRSFVEMCGYARHELLGRTAVELGMWTNMSSRADWLKQVRTRGSSHGDEFQFRTKSGEIRTGLVSAELIEFGGAPCLLTTAVDITHRKMMEEELRIFATHLEKRVAERTQELQEMNALLQKSEEKWRSLVENAPDFIVNADRNGVIQYTNRAVAGLTVEEAIGKSIYEYIPGENHETLQAKLQYVLETGQPTTYEASGVGPHGTLSWYETRISPITHGTEVVGVTFVATDVTERKRIEERDRLRQIEVEHLARMATVGQMTTELAHELNQPLAAIANYASGCIKRMEKGEFHVDELVATAGEVSRQAHRASETVARLRRFVQKREANPEPNDIRKIVDESLAMIAAEIHQSGIKPRLQFSRSLPRVIADNTFIVHVLVNLCLNAIEAMKETPLRQRELEIEGMVNDSGTLAIAVRDSGCGIEPGKEETVFEPFFTGRKEGLGLGLAISRNVIDKHHGTLTCCNREAGGAEFRFTLPIHEEGLDHD